MALKCNFTTNTIFKMSENAIVLVAVPTKTYQNSYIQVGYIKGNKQHINIRVLIYEDETKNILIAKRSYEFVPNMNGENFIKQAYEYLKTLPEFADAVDC